MLLNLHVGFANSLANWIPKFWSNAALAILEESMTITNVVNRDFSADVQEYGDTVNIQRPNQFVGKFKSQDDNITKQDATAANIAVKLDRHLHVSFGIKDLERALAKHDMIETYIRPAAVAMARKVDKLTLGQVYQFMSNRDPGGNNIVGQLGGMTAANVRQYLIAARRQMNRNRAPEDNRWLWLTDDAEAVALEETHFTKANEAGMTAGLRQAVLGELYGFNVAASYNTPFVENLTLPAVEVDDLASDAAAGATTVVTDAGATYAVGEYITFPGTDNVPYKVIGIATDTLTLNRPIRYALTAATQDVQRINTGTVDLAGHTGVSAYPAAYDKEIQVDGTGVPQVGQLVSFATAGTPNVNLAGEYTILDVTDIGGGKYQIDLDHPLETAIVDGDIVGYGPNGSYNFFMVPDAFTLVMRPMEPVIPGAGGLSGVAIYNNLALRTTIGYDVNAQEHIVTLDMLLGVKQLDANFAGLLAS
jgi:hypothetical protein